MSQLKNIHGKNHQGFSLIEVLVALVVLSIGMLSVATLYVRGLQFSQTALIRSEAVQLAADMADRIRSNSTATVSYGAGGANNNCIEGGIDCTPIQLAANDIFVRQNDIATKLPGGFGVILVNPGTLPSTYTITVSWIDRGSPGPLSYILRVQI